MYRFLFLSISFVILLWWATVYSAPAIYRPSVKEVEDAAKPCLPWWNGIAINDKYTCPVGNFVGGNGQWLSKEKIECSIQIALSLEAIDKKSALWTKQLQSSREKDVNKWIDDIRIQTKSADNSFMNQYSQVCSLTGWTMSEDGKWIGCAKTMEFFPETACRDIVNQKVTALQNVWYILASKGIAKGFQNDKDKNLEKIKSAYDLINEKWSQYKRIVSNAVSKFTAYIKEAVKG